MSPGRSRSGGMRRLTHVEPEIQILAERAARAPRPAGRGWWWPGCARSPAPARCRPAGRSRAPATARSSLACSRISISLISSSSSVPPIAPPRTCRCRRATAPEKAPFSWPNSSDLQQVFRDRRAVQRDERPAGAARAAMDVARQHLLAGAGLAGDQHRGLGRAPPARRGAPWPASPGRARPARGFRRTPLPGSRRSGRDRAAAAGTRARRRGSRARRRRDRRRCRRRRPGRPCARPPARATSAPMSCARSHSTRSISRVGAQPRPAPASASSA